MLFLTSLTLLLNAGCGIKDLRDDRWSQAGIAQEKAAKGKIILQKAIDHHSQGSDWDMTHELSFQLYDQWNDPLGRGLAMPLKTNKDSSSWKIDLVSNNVEVKYHDGKHAGEIWGISDNEVFNKSNLPISDKIQRKSTFYYRAIPFLLTTIFNLDDADITGSMQPVTLKDGKTYERVFVTWSSAQPNSEIDQYVLYFNSDNELTYADHTVREMSKALKATAHYSKYQRVGSFLLPGKIDVKFHADGKFKGHEMTFTDIHLDGQAPEQPPLTLR